MNEILQILVVIFFSFLGIFLTIILLFRKGIIRSLTGDTIWQPNFDENQIVFTPEPLKRTILLGAALYVPPGVQAIVARPPSGEPQRFNTGDHIVNFIEKFRFYQFVDITRRKSNFLVKKGATNDGLKVDLEVRISWQVNDTVLVATITDPVNQLMTLIGNAIRNVTIQYAHDNLVPISGQAPVSNAELIEKIFHEFGDEPILDGITLRSLVIKDRIGDPEREKVAHETVLQEIDKNLQEANLLKRFELNEIQNEVNHLEMMYAQERERLERHFELEVTNFKVAKEERLKPIKEQEIELERMAKELELDLEREKMLFKARSAALDPVLKIFATIISSPNSNRIIGSWDMNRLGDLFEHIVGSLWDEDHSNPADFGMAPRPPRNAREKLTHQLFDLWQLDGYVGHRIQEMHDGNVGLVIFIYSKQAMFLYDVSGLEPTILRITLRSTLGDTGDVRNLGFYYNLPLLEVIKRLERRFSSPKRGISDTIDWD